MAPTPEYGEPSEGVAGDTLTWRRAAFPDYLITDGWALSYAIVYRGSDATQANLTWSSSWVTEDDVEYTVEIPAASTAPLLAGQWEITGYLTLGTDRRTVVQPKPLLLKPNNATAATASRRSFAERMVALLEARLLELGATNIESYSVGQRAVHYRQVEGTTKQLAMYRARAARERGHPALGTPVHIHLQPTGGVEPDHWTAP